MSEIHDVFVRAYAVSKKEEEQEDRRKRKAKPQNSNLPKWPAFALVFDTETRITADQSLTFGVFRFCELKNDRYSVVREGLFYADNLPAKERKVLDNYARTAMSDAKVISTRIPFCYSRSDFMKRVFWPAIKWKGALICGLNLPFDLTRSP